MGTPPVSAPTASRQSVPLNALIADPSPIATPRPARPPNRKALRRFRPVLDEILVYPAAVSMRKLGFGTLSGAADPPSIAKRSVGLRACPLRPINLIRERPNAAPSSAPLPHSASAAAQTPARGNHDDAAFSSPEATRRAGSTISRPRQRTVKVRKRGGLVESLGLLPKLKALTPNLGAAFAQIGNFLGGVRRIAVPALVAIVVFLGAGFLVSTNGGLLAAAEENISPRAAFLMEDDFGGGADDGWYAPQSLIPEESGAVRVEGLVLHSETMQLSSYRMDFEAKLSSGMVGWVIGARDHKNYHLFKLEKSAPRSESPYRVVHYAVVAGEADTSNAVSTEVSLDLNEHVVHRFSVRVREGRVVTFINGQSVDYWVPQEWQAGGVGFFGDESESSLICYVTAYSNQDFLGLSLAVALDALKSFQGFVAGSA